MSTQEPDRIVFNKPHLTGKEWDYVKSAVEKGYLAGNGAYTKKCQKFFESRYGFKKCLLTSSCTDALEMCALLINIKEGDEVIIPSFTFVSTANAFVLRGAKIVFADSSLENPNLDVQGLEQLITPQTKAIVVVHYAGIACNMDAIMAIAERHSLFVIEDAAHSIDSFYNQKPLGSIGHLAAFSFHETKNIISGEGGMLAVNDKQFLARAEIIWEKGTNRAAFFKGEVDKYGWVDIGSSFLPSELIAAFLLAQLESLNAIQKRRKEIWNLYHSGLKKLEAAGRIKRPIIPPFASNNGHMFYIVCNNNSERDGLIQYMAACGIHCVFHYLPLHQSAFYKDRHGERSLPFSEHYSQCIIRLPFYYDLSLADQEMIISNIYNYYSSL